MKISVITPLYKGNEYVSDLYNMIKSNAKVLNYRYKDVSIEYIFVNDYPQKSIFLENIKNIKDVEIKIIENKKNLGIHESRVKALKIATGDYVLFLDQDDVIDNKTLLSQIHRLKSLSDKKKADVLICNGYRKFEDRKEPLYLKNIAMRLAKKEMLYIYGTDMILSPGQCLIRKKAIPKEWEKFILKVNGCDDFLLWLLMFQKKCIFEINDYNLFYHTENEKNFSASSDNMTASFMEMCRLLEENGLIDEWKIKVLKRRYRLKIKLKSNISKSQKIKLMLKNIDIMFFTFLYKTCGYY